MRIAVDAMGGDYAPRAAVEGALSAVTRDGLAVLLVGDRTRVEEELARLGRRRLRKLTASGLVEVVHAEQVVGMDEPPITPLRKKRRSSVRLCAELVAAGRAQAFVSAGNTGAAMIVAKMLIGTIAGVDRPALAAVLPTARGRCVLLDVGANVETKAAQLREFAVMGHSYAQVVVGVRKPRIGLLSIGEEDSKGTDVTRETLKVLKETGLNFLGNVEGQDLFEGNADVVVCDGFVGNVVLKSAESLVTLVGSMLRQEVDKSWRTRLGALLVRPALERLRRRTDYEEYGAVPLLGIDGGCFIGHGRSNARAFHSALQRAAEFCAAEIHLEIADKVATLHSEEERLLGKHEVPA